MKYFAYISMDQWNDLLFIALGDVMCVTLKKVWAMFLQEGQFKERIPTSGLVLTLKNRVFLNKILQ